jgi:hypothetical protein
MPLPFFTHLAGTSESLSSIEPLVRRFGGNPLLVKILAQVVQAEGTAALSELTSPAGTLAPDGQMIQGILYTRILRRLRTKMPTSRGSRIPASFYDGSPRT